MRARFAFGVILVSFGFFRVSGAVSLFVQHHRSGGPTGRLEKVLMEVPATGPGELDTNELSFVSNQFQRINFKNPEEMAVVVHLPREVHETAFLLVKRDKRYSSSYLTLCHFKICNMGRKRTARYVNVIKADNE